MAVSVRLRNGSQLRDQIVHSGLSQNALAVRCGISAARINQLLRGIKRDVAIDKAAAIEDALAVPRGHLFVLCAQRDLIRDYLDATVDVA